MHATAREFVALNMGSEIKTMVESYWQAFLSLGTKDPLAAAALAERFSQRVEEIGARLGGEHGLAFRELVELEREGMLREYQSDPPAFRRRLGVAPLPPAMSQIPTARTSSLTDTAVRTAVRATVWESIRALFRAMR